MVFCSDAWLRPHFESYLTWELFSLEEYTDADGPVLQAKFFFSLVKQLGLGANSIDIKLALNIPTMALKTELKTSQGSRHSSAKKQVLSCQ